MHATSIMANLRVAEVEAAKSFYTDCLGRSTEEFCPSPRTPATSRRAAACMRTLQFGTDFADWSEFALLVRHQLDPADGHNTFLALKP
jgi:hypothetical protein